MRALLVSAAWVAVGSVTPGCYASHSRDATRMDGGGPRDAGLHDAGLRDAGLRDAGLRGAGPRDAGLRDAGLRDAGPRDAGSLRGGNHCIGFGLGVPVVGHPPPSLPLLCGRDCTRGEACPEGSVCHDVYAAERAPEAPEGWRVTDRIVTRQCAPPEGRCDPAPFGRFCGGCDADEHCR